MHQQAIQKIEAELDSRIERLEEHRYDPIDVTGDHVEELNQAVSKVIGTALLGELKSLKTFVSELT